MKYYDLGLKGDTRGELATEDDIQVGDVVTVTLYDENGQPIECTGEVESILSVENR